MTTILFFDQSRCRRVSVAQPPGRGGSKTGQVLVFTGVRHELIQTTPALYAPVRHEPMFDDPAPRKPRGKKPKRGKNI